MPFRQLPASLRVYILSYFLTTPIILLLVLWEPAPRSWPMVGWLAACTALLATWKVDVGVTDGKITLSVAGVCLALLMEGPQAAVLIAAIAALIGSHVQSSRGEWRVRFETQDWYRTALNVGSYVLSVGLGALCYARLESSVLPAGLGQAAGLAVAVVLSFFINTLGVALAIANAQSRPWLEVWQASYLWTAPGNFAAAMVAAATYAVYRAAGPLSLIGVFVVYLVYYSFRTTGPTVKSSALADAQT